MISDSMTGTRVLSFSSGKGGVGKTSLVANLGSIWAKAGKKTLLIDGDWSLGKLGIAMGVRPRWTVEKVLSGEIDLAAAVQEVGDNLYLLASPSGVLGFEELDEQTRNQLFFEIEGLRNRFDLILFDHSSGLHSGVTPFAAASHQQVIVTTSEPTSYTDAYAIMKILSQKYSIREFWLMVTMSHSQSESDKIIERFMDVVRSQLEVRIRLLDIFPWEPRLSEALRKQKPFVDIYPGDSFTQKLGEICRKLERSPLTLNHGLRFFYGSDNEVGS
jgi:flagellar biosynthesis protein FlhG